MCTAPPRQEGLRRRSLLRDAGEAIRKYRVIGSQAVVIERMIAIAKEIAMQLVPGKCVPKLLRGPRSRWMFRHGDMHDASTIMSKEHQDEQQPARRPRHNEAVGCDELLCMVGQERPPGLGGEGPVADHVLGDGRLRDSESEFQQFTMGPSERCRDSVFSSRRFEIAVVRERPCSSRSSRYGINSMSSIESMDVGFG